MEKNSIKRAVGNDFKSVLKEFWKKENEKKLKKIVLKYYKNWLKKSCWQLKKTMLKIKLR